MVHCTRYDVYGCTFRPDQVHAFPLRGSPPSPVTRAALFPHGPRAPASQRGRRDVFAPPYLGCSVTVAFSIATFSTGRSLGPVRTSPIFLTVFSDSSSATL